MTSHDVFSHTRPSTSKIKRKAWVQPIRKCQGCHKVVTRWSQGCSIVTRLLQACYHFVQNTKVVTSLVTRLLHHAWLQLTITTSTCSVVCIALLLGQHPNGSNGCQGCILRGVGCVCGGGGGGGGGALPPLHHYFHPPLTFLSFTSYY